MLVYFCSSHILTLFLILERGSAHRSGDFLFNVSGPRPSPSVACTYRWESGVRFISSYKDINGNLARHGGTSRCAPYKGRTLLLVHIGKTAGSSLLKLLRDVHIPHSDVHLFSLRHEAIERYTDIVITVRDPLNRTLSAFNWDSPLTKSGRLQKRNKSSAFYSLFPDMNAYASNLSADNAHGRIARRAEGHIALDTCYYLAGVLDSLRKHGSVYAVDAASFLDDVRAVSLQLGWDINLSSSFTLPRVNEIKMDASIVSLTTPNLNSLVNHLEMIGEYAIYREVLNKFQIKPKT